MNENKTNRSPADTNKGQIHKRLKNEIKNIKQKPMNKMKKEEKHKDTESNIKGDESK